MDKWFQSKWFVRILSLIFAVSLYLFVTLEVERPQSDSAVVPSVTNEVQVLEDVPLDVRIDSENYVVSGVPEFVTVSLEGRTSILTPTVRQRNFTVFVDLTDLEEGEHVVDIEHENIPNELTAYIEPKSIEVVIEKRATKNFAVNVEFVNADKLPLGYEVGEPEVTPNTVSIISSESVIERIAMVKVYIDLTDLKESIVNRELPISVYDIQGNDLNVRIEPESVKVSVPVERPSKTVPLTLNTQGDLDSKFQLDSIELPEEIEIFARREILNDVTEIKTKEFDLSTVDASGTYEVELDFPEGVISNETTVDVEVELNESRTFTGIPIEIVGDKTVTFIEPNEAIVDIEATGRENIIKSLTKGDFSSLIDIGNLSDGRHVVDIEVTGPRGITVEAKVKRATIEIES